MFCLPWFLTWYSHTLTKYEHVGRLYDYFLASEALIPLYLVPIIVVHRHDDVFSTECDMACLHQVLSQVIIISTFCNLGCFVVFFICL